MGPFTLRLFQIGDAFDDPLLNIVERLPERQPGSLGIFKGMPRGLILSVQQFDVFLVVLFPSSIPHILLLSRLTLALSHYQ